MCCNGLCSIVLTPLLLLLLLKRYAAVAFVVLAVVVESAVGVTVEFAVDSFLEQFLKALETLESRN